jgi:hypothetical protein
MSRAAPSVPALPALAALALALLARPLEAGPAAVERIARADGVELRVELDRAVLEIDERVGLRLRVEAPGALGIELPEVEPAAGGLALVERVRSEPRSLPDGRRLWEERILLEPTATGTLPLPPLAVGYRAADATTARRLVVEPIAVEVRSVLPPGEAQPAPREVAPPVPLADPPAGLGPWLGVALLALLLGLAVVLIRGRRRPAAAVEAEPDPEARALAELARLEAAAPSATEPVEEQHVRLARILRDYARGRLGLDAPRLTTEELTGGLARLGPRLAAPAGVLTGLLAACDRVKFARHRPSVPELRADLATARTLIHETAAAVAEAGAAAPAGR